MAREKGPAERNLWGLTGYGGQRQCEVMARTLRVQYPGAVYHVMSRGDRREPIFVDDLDRQKFLQTLAETCQKTGWQVRAPRRSCGKSLKGGGGTGRNWRVGARPMEDSGGPAASEGISGYANLRD